MEFEHYREDFSHLNVSQSGDDDDEGGDDEEGGDEPKEDEEPPSPSCSDYIMHFLTVFWKLLFACIPPTGECAALIKTLHLCD